MGAKKTSDQAFQTKRTHKLDFKEKKLSPQFDHWLGNEFVEEVTMDGDEKRSPREPTRN
jgi:hypothetical protein